MKNWLKAYSAEHAKIVKELDHNKWSKIIAMVKTAGQNGKQIFIVGNGGSAACASHLQVDLNYGASKKRAKPFKAFCPSNEVPWMTALGNDIGYQAIFSRQMLNFCGKGDLLIVISVSGNSPNLLEAAALAKKRGMKVAAIVGDHNGKIIKLADTSLIIPSGHYGHVEDIQMFICHSIAYFFTQA
ncbi:MAG: hypothetical protein A2297_05385 [Elusimicrobia bacterium RIFOXYB2_FULL_48_7]|nr:MAG: hypothetical protein A2297_05385 [Elusimicrobia bacterium RIFOXYB2_FULL_48_7]